MNINYAYSLTRASASGSDYFTFFLGYFGFFTNPQRSSLTRAGWSSTFLSSINNLNNESQTNVLESPFVFES